MELGIRRSVEKVGRWVARLTVLLLVVAGSAFALATSASAATTYVYTTFKGDGAADQELWVYQSTNATSFGVLADTNYRGPTGVLRDPSIINHNGRYYIAHTVQSWTTNSTYFNIASSPDLVTWTHVASVNSGIADTRFVWAPEFFVEGSTVRVIASVAQTTCSNCFRPYVYTAQDSALTSWSGPAQMGGLGTNYIDTFVVRSGNTYHAFVKNETSKYIERWTSTTNLTSGWTSRGALWSSGYEGPALVQMENGSWRIYVDRYTNGGIWTATSSDLNTWSGLSSVSCAGCRHGTVLAVPSSSPAERYRVTARHSGKVVDVMEASTADNAEVKQWGWNGGGNQIWAFEDAGGGFVRIVNQNSGKCLDVAGASTADRANVIQYTCNSATNQQWQWRPIGSYFQLVARHSGKCLDVVSAGTGDGADIQQYACGGQTNQQWSRTPV